MEVRHLQCGDRTRLTSFRIILLPALVALLQSSASLAEDLYDYSTSPVIKLDSSNFQSLVVDSTETWLVEFYAPWCGHCRNLAPAWNKAAKRLKGVARVGAVNCDDYQDLAQKYGVQGFPTIKVFKGMGASSRKPDDYQGARSAGAIVSYAKSVMPTFVAGVKRSGVEAFFNDEKNLPHVLLFTDKKDTSPLYKGLSATYFGRLALGEVKKNDAGDLLKTYGITNFPTLISFKPNAGPSDEATTYHGAINPDSLIEYFDSLAGDAPAGGKGTKKQPEPVFKQPDAFKDDIRVLESSKAYKEYCGNRPDNRMCGLAFLPKGNRHPIFGSLKEVAKQFRFDNMAILAIDSDAEYGSMVAKAFEIDVPRGAFLVIRSGKPKFAVMPEDKDVSIDNIKSFLDSVVSGNVRYRKLQGELPQYDPPTKVDKKEEETQKGSPKTSKKEATTNDGNTTAGNSETGEDEEEEVCEAHAHAEAKCGAKEEL